MIGRISEREKHLDALLERLGEEKEGKLEGKEKEKEKEKEFVWERRLWKEEVFPPFSFPPYLLLPPPPFLSTPIIHRAKMVFD